MKKITYLASSAILIAAMAVTPLVAFGQTQTTMPVLYDGSGAAVNTGTGNLTAGYYYLFGGPSQGGRQVYYYGNGTYYDPVTMSYGGSVSDPYGTAGVTINLAQATTPSAPNTGAGGYATSNWLILVAAALAVSGSLAYIGMRAYDEYLARLSGEPEQAEGSRI